MMRALILALMLATPAAASLTPEQLDRVAAEPAPDARLDLGTGLPMLVVFVDFDCGAMCDAVLSWTGAAALESGLVPGKDFALAVIGIDPRDGQAAADAMIDAQLPPELVAATHVLRPGADELVRITGALGYHYAFDAENDRFAHPATPYVLTAQGRVARVLPALATDPGDLRLALVEAGQGRTGGFADRLALFCYGFDAASGRYSLAISRLLMVASLGFALALGGAILWMLRRERAGRAA